MNLYKYYYVDLSLEKYFIFCGVIESSDYFDAYQKILDDFEGQSASSNLKLVEIDRIDK